MAKLSGAAKAAFLARMNKGRRAAGFAPIRPAGSPASTAAAGATRGGARASNGSRKRRASAGFLSPYIDAGAQLLGVLLADKIVRRVPMADTALKRGLAVAAVAELGQRVVLPMTRRFVGLPQGVLAGLLAGLRMDAVARASANIRAKVPLLSGGGAGGGLLSGHRRYGGGGGLSYAQLART